jgi:hypothetical protein
MSNTLWPAKFLMSWMLKWKAIGRRRRDILLAAATFPKTISINTY